MSLRRVAWMLGILAVLCVLGTTAAALTHDGSSSAGGGGGAGGAAAPGAHWRRSPAGTAVAYRDRAGHTLVMVRAPWVYREGWCAQADDSSRAFAGFVPLGRQQLPVLARRWADAVTLDVTTGRAAGPVRLSVTDGRVDADLAVPSGPCNPPREHLTVVARGDRALVLVRDVGVPDALSAADADRLLDTLR